MWYKASWLAWWFYIDDQDHVWKVWENGQYRMTDLDADEVANHCTRRDMPEFGSDVLRGIDALEKMGRIMARQEVPCGS